MSSCSEPELSAPRSRVHLAKRGLAVALIDRGEPGEGTSYGNAGIIEGNTVFPAAFPSSFAELARIALKRSPVANYHLAHLPRVVPWLLAFRAASQPARLIETAKVMRPLLARAVAEHEALAAEAGAAQLSQPPRLAQALSHRRRVRRARRRNSNWRRASASPMCRSTATARWRSNRRWRRYSAMPCIGAAR